MIKSFGDKDTEKFFKGGHVRRIGPELQANAMRKLDFVNLAANIDQLRIPPNNKLEKLKGDLAGFWSIRINKQFRVIFRWEEANAYDVQIVDYH